MYAWQIEHVGLLQANNDAAVAEQAGGRRGRACRVALYAAPASAHTCASRTNAGANAHASVAAAGAGPPSTAAPLAATEALMCSRTAATHAVARPHAAAPLLPPSDTAAAASAAAPAPQPACQPQPAMHGTAAAVEHHTCRAAAADRERSSETQTQQRRPRPFKTSPRTAALLLTCHAWTVTCYTTHAWRPRAAALNHVWPRHASSRRVESTQRQSVGMSIPCPQTRCGEA